ncbi:MAG: hypothetical protein ACJ8FC_10915 [Sphingomicrobium sp.]
MSHKRLVTVLRRLWTAHMAIGLALVVGVVPASFAQDPQLLGQGRSGGTGIEPEKQPTHEKTSDGLRSEARHPAGVTVAVPIGSVSVGPELVDGEPIYVRRMKVTDGMTMVEVSTTPFTPVLSSKERLDILIARPDQPASW